MHRSRNSCQVLLRKNKGTSLKSVHISNEGFRTYQVEMRADDWTGVTAAYPTSWQGQEKNLANHNPGSIRWQNPKVTLWTPQYSKVQSLMVGSPRKASLAHPNACGQRRVCIGSDPQGRIFGSHNRIPALLEPYSSSWCLQYWKPDRFALFSFDALEPLAFPPLNPATSRSILYPCFYQQVSPYTKKQRCFMLRNQFCCQHCQQKARSKIL